MKPFNDFKAEKAKQASFTLPAGGYVCKIIDATVETFASKSGGTIEKLRIQFDIDEGEHFQHFAELYNASTYADKKWKGNHRLAIPDESSEFAAGQKKAFNNFIACIEESNAGYHWAWEEKTLKGKIVGLVFRNREWEYNGKTGWTTEVGAVVSVEDIRTGNYKVPADKPLNPTATAAGGTATGESFVNVSEDDIPF